MRNTAGTTIRVGQTPNTAHGTWTDPVFTTVSTLWQDLGFINSTQAQQVRTHYGGYSVVSPLGLKIITCKSQYRLLRLA